MVDKESNNVDLEEAIDALGQRYHDIHEELELLRNIEGMANEASESTQISAQVKLGGKLSLWLEHNPHSRAAEELLDLDELDWVEVSDSDEPSQIWHCVYHIEHLQPY